MQTLSQAVHAVAHIPRSWISLAVGEYRYAVRLSVPIEQARADLIAALPLRSERDYSLADLLDAVASVVIDAAAPVTMPGKINLPGKIKSVRT